tara:strand:+ start:449 stop:739 length:291 start_codon:yes stop_codon:yes gene_type:complete
MGGNAMNNIITKQAYTNDKGSRLFTCTKVGRKWVTGIWWEYPVKLVKIPLSLYATFTNMKGGKTNATARLKEMAIFTYGSKKELPVGLKRELFGRK